MPRTDEESTPDLWTKLARFVLIAIVAAVGYSLFAGQYGFLHMMEKNGEIDGLKTQERNYTAKLVDLEMTKKRLLTDSLYIEKLARKNYQFGRPSEKIIEF